MGAFEVTFCIKCFQVKLSVWYAVLSTVCPHHSLRLDDDADLEMYTFSEFGTVLIKQLKCSPDGFFQMALQLTYYR